MRRIRTAVVVAAVSVLALSGPSWPAAAQSAVPPPVNPGLRPSTAEAAPYQAPSQVGPPVPVGECLGPAPRGGPTPGTVPAPQQRMRIEEAHEFATGRGQTVAVIDTGVAPHPRLAGRLVDGGDYVLDESGMSDCDGHGTVVAGIIAAAKDQGQGTGFVGVAPDARILAIRQSSQFYQVETTDETDRTETQAPGDVSSLAEAVNRAVDTRGVTVINISEAACFLPGTADDQALHDAVRYAADRGVVVVAAAANANDADTDNPCRQNPEGGVQTLVSPARFDEDVLAVGATDVTNGEPAGFTISGPWVDVAAPGTGIVSLDRDGEGLTDTLAYPDSERFPIQGTSFATPYVAGVVALVRERFRNLSARQVIERIERTAQHTAGPGGRDRTLGYGVIDPVAALTDVLPGQGGAPAPEPVEPGRLQDFRLPIPEDPARRTVAFAGAGGGIAALGVTVLTVFTVRRYRRSTPTQR